MFLKKMFGFTLLELIVSLMIAIIIIGAAIPTFRTFTANSRGESLALQYASLLRFARSEAIRLGQDNLVQIDHISIGWTVTAKPSNQVLRIVQTPVLNDPTLVTPFRKLVINSLGRPVSMLGDSLCFKAPGCSRGYMVTFLETGRVEMETTTCQYMTRCP